MRYGIDVYALRIGNVIEPHEYDMFPGFLANLPSRKRNAWSYIDARDLGEIVHLAIQKDGLGFQVFNAVNDTVTANIPTREVLGRYCPNVRITANLATTRRRCRTRRRVRCWASGKRTTGGIRQVRIELVGRGLAKGVIRLFTLATADHASLIRPTGYGLTKLKRSPYEGAAVHSI